MSSRPDLLSDRDLPAAAHAWLARCRPAQVVVVARTADDARRVTSGLPGHAVVRTVLLAAAPAAPAAPAGPAAASAAPGQADDLVRLHHDLTVAGRPHLVVDVAGGPGGPARLARVAPHLRVGGLLVVALPADATSPERRALEERAQELLATQADPDLLEPVRFDRRPQTVRDLHALASTVSDIVVEDGWLRLSGALDVVVRVHEKRVNAYLAARPGRGRVLDVVAATSWRPAGVMTSTEAGETRAERVDCPELTLREYRNVVAEGRMVVRGHGLLFPESHRDPIPERSSSAGVTDWLPGFARLTRKRKPRASLEGPWFYLDNPFRGHFGHAYSEQLGHLWAWERARAEHPDLRLLMLGGDRVRAWELDLLEAAGVPRDRVHASGGAVRVETLVTATPGYVIERYVHPELRPLYERVGVALRELAPNPDAPARLFVTRRGEQRQCRNTPEVEQLVAEHGFEVLAPEQGLSLAEQAGRFARATTVAGFGGSGMFHVLTAPAVERLLMVSNTTYPVANEKLIAGFRGLDIGLFRATSEVVTERPSKAMFHSPHTVDWTREGAALRDALERLPAGR